MLKTLIIPSSVKGDLFIGTHIGYNGDMQIETLVIDGKQNNITIYNTERLSSISLANMPTKSLSMTNCKALTSVKDNVFTS